MNLADVKLFIVYKRTIKRGLSIGGCDLRLLGAEDCLSEIPNHLIEAVRTIEDRKQIEHDQ